MRRKILLLSLIFLNLFAVNRQPAFAQSSGTGFTTPINISRSGAAAGPQIVVSPTRDIQVFWWDRFTGLTSATFLDATGSGEYAWSEPFQAPISSSTLLSSPQVFADNQGFAHAFWWDTAPGGMLQRSSIRIGARKWAPPAVVGDKILVFDFQPRQEGGFYLAYLRAAQSEDLPAGVYFEIYTPGLELQKRVQVSTSLYFRLLQPDAAWLRLWVHQENELFLTWQDPELDQAMLAHSTDGGLTWAISSGVDAAEPPAAQMRVFSAQTGEISRVFRANNGAACALYVQTQQAETQGGGSSAWSNAHRILETLTTCPSGDQFYPLDGYLYWQWGAGSDQLTWAAYDANQATWSAPKGQRFSSIDPLTDRQIQMTELRSVLLDDRLVVVGTAFGDVWATTGSFNVREFIFAPPPAWSNAVTLQQAGLLPNLPALAVDMRGMAHLVLVERDALGARPQGLSYARWDPQSGRPPVPTNLFSSSLGEVAAEPFLLVDYQDKLHLVWVGGSSGQVLYAQVSAGEATTPSAWSREVVLGPQGPANSPQLSLDADGRLYLIYAVGINEMRGIYLVHSADGGKTWNSPVQVFDAATAGLTSVAHPTLAATPDGILHAAWVQAGAPGSGTPFPIFYSSSADAGQSWSEPAALTGNGFDWPRLAVVNDQLHLLFWKQDGSIWHRWARMNEFSSIDALSWTVAAQVPGWRNVGAPFGVAVNGLAPDNMLHLVGIDPGLEQPLYSAWNGSSWGRLEYSASISQDPASSPLAAASPLKGGELVANWLAPLPDQPEQSGVHLAARAIPDVVVASLPTLPAGAPPAPATPEPATNEPAPATATPGFPGQAVVLSSGGPPPILMGGGIAAAIVGLALLGRSVWKRSSEF